MDVSVTGAKMFSLKVTVWVVISECKSKTYVQLNLVKQV